MLTRTKSIFHIGDDINGDKAMRDQEQEEKEALSSINADSEKKPVGLQVIIESLPPIGLSVVTKCTMNAFKPKEFGFLKTCFFCHKDLSSQMDVFIYKGEQTFCSVDCRGEKMAMDRRRELETHMMRRRGEFHKNYKRDSNIPKLNRHEIITLVT